jgi:hypothetical protein
VKRIFKTGLCFLVLAVVAALFPFFVLAGPPDSTNSSLTATTVPADGGTASSITVTLIDSGLVALAGDSVSISISGNATAVVTPSSLTLDANGQATFSATSTTAGTYNIDVTDITQAATLTALGTITFDAVPTPTPTLEPVTSSDENSTGESSSSSCSNQAPTDAPSFYQVQWNKTSATLFFVQPATQFDGYTISYGLNPSASNYSVSFQQGYSTGAIQYTINDLQPKTGYYFKVRAKNGCAAGPWSEVRNVNVTNSVSAAGPGNLAMLLGAGGFSLIVLGACLFILL